MKIITQKHMILGGKVNVYKRENDSVWQCSTYLTGKNQRMSTHETSLGLAKEFAKDWYMTLLGKKRDGVQLDDKTFQQVAEQFLVEFDILTEVNIPASGEKEHETLHYPEDEKEGEEEENE